MFNTREEVAHFLSSDAVGGFQPDGKFVERHFRRAALWVCLAGPHPVSEPEELLLGEIGPIPVWRKKLLC